MRPSGEQNGAVSTERDPDWASYWCSPDTRVEAMHAHFRRHVYHRHAHETYSFGVTETGAQAFTCRGASRVSAAGMVMALNPDDPHDGHAAAGEGRYHYRMVHVAEPLVREIVTEAGDLPGGLPLFTEPVVHDPVLARTLYRLHTALTGTATGLERDERLTAAVTALVDRAATARMRAAGGTGGGPGSGGLISVTALARARSLLADRFAEEVTAGQLAEAAGCSRFALYRTFRAVHGMAPSDYQRQVRLRTARSLIARGTPLAEAATAAGFADQSHLTRWFTRYYGVTPGTYQRAAAPR